MCQILAQLIELFIFDFLTELAIAFFIEWLVLIFLVFIKFSIVMIDFLDSPHLSLYQNLGSILYNSVMQITKLTRTKAYNPKTQLMAEILHKIKQNRWSFYFQHPVDWQELGLEDYPHKIRAPMDLSTIQKKLNDKEYQSIEHFYKDLRLIWKNCYTYNGEGHWLSKIAIKFEQETKRCIKNYYPNIKIKFKKNKTNKDPIKLQDQQQDFESELNYEEMAQKDPKFIKKDECQRKNQSEFEEELSLKRLFLQVLEKQTEQHISMLFLMMKTRCPSSPAHDEFGNIQINLEKVDYETVYLAMMQILRWNAKQQ